MCFGGAFWTVFYESDAVGAEDSVVAEGAAVGGVGEVCGERGKVWTDVEATGWDLGGWMMETGSFCGEGETGC